MAISASPISPRASLATSFTWICPAKVNTALEDTPELINEDAFANWIIKVKLSDSAELDALMDAAAYTAACAE